MLDMGLPAHLLNLIMYPHKRQKAKVQAAGVVSADMQGVRQGCMLSPHLFNIPLEAVYAGAFLGSEDIRGNCPWKTRAPRGCPVGKGFGEGAVPPPQKIFVILHCKWCIFMQFDVGIFTLKGV